MTKRKKCHKYGSMQTAIVLFVFVTMLCSSAASAMIMLFLHNFFGSDFLLLRTPIIMLIVFFLMSTVIGLCISGIVGEFLLKPVRDVISAMKRVEKGDFSVRVNDKSDNEEIGNLIDSFNKMTEELSGIEMFRENFIDSFSHEFKTPIVSIEGFAKQLKKSGLSDEKRSEYIDIIISESKRLTKLSSNILLLNKFENQQIITDKSEFSLTEQIRNCVLLLEKQWTAKNLDLDIDMEEITYVSNSEMLSQVWVNIISNAIKFSPDDEKLSISLHKNSDNIKAVFTDRGIGMSDETIRHIFERFYQGDKAHSAEGNGLGLSLVKRIVELCGGTIRVESQYGIGTKFIVILPLTEKKPDDTPDKTNRLNKLSLSLKQRI